MRKRERIKEWKNTEGGERRKRTEWEEKMKMKGKEEQDGGSG